MTSTLWKSKQSTVVFVVVLLAVFMTNLDLFIVNVALPSIGTSLAGHGRSTSLNDLSWVLNAYAITLGALLVVMGRFGDRIGQRTLFIAGVVVFTAASLACAIAPNLWVLVAARVVQAAGAAAQLPSSLALLLASVPAQRHTSATRSWVAVGGLSAAGGPVVGGLLVQLDWRWVFVVNLPVGLFAALAGLASLPRGAGGEGGRLPDLWGAVLITVGVGALSAALVEAPGWGWGSTATIGLLVLAAAAIAWFGFRSSRHHTPLVEPYLLRQPRFGVANAGAFAFGAAFAIMLLSSVLWCQDVWHWSALLTGLALAPGPATVPLVTALTKRAATRFGHGPLVVAGGLLFAAGMLWRVGFASITPDYARDLLPCMLFSGAGVGLALGSLVAGAVQSLPAHRAGTGSAVVNSMRQISSTVGVALLVSIVGSSINVGSVGDFRIAWIVSASLSLAATVAGVRLSRRQRRVDEPATARVSQSTARLEVAVLQPEYE